MSADNQTCLIMANHYEKNGNIEKARVFYEKSLALEPSAATHERLGLLLKKQGDIVGSKEHFLKGNTLDPENITCIYNLGIMERIEGNYESALSRYLKLKELGWDESNLYMSMGVLYSETGELHKALTCYKAAIDRDDKNELLLFNYSLCLMTLGDYDKGLELYEKRIWHARPPGEEWAGEKDAEVLLSPEQGNGDIIQFSRYIRHLRAKCSKVTLLCNFALVDLMRGVEGVDDVIEFNPGDEFVQVEEEKKEEGLSETVPYGKFLRIMSIPHALGLNPTQIPFEKYINADEQKVAKWKSRMDSSRLKVGVCWQGGKRKGAEMTAIDKKRSIPLKDLLPILSIEEVEFYSLQKGDEQSKEFPFIKDFMNESEDFTDTAAIIENLDLVISVDTAVSHLAAALNKPTWMLSRKGGCWRWGVNGQSTFWYTSMTIYRQEKMNCWAQTIAKVAEDLRKFCAT